MIDVSILPNKLSLTTVRIVGHRDDGKIVSGTAFRVGFSENQLDSMLITNRHVLEGITTARLTYTESIDGKPQIGRFVDTKIPDFEKRWIGHPDAEVDLAAIPIKEIRQDLLVKGKQRTEYNLHLLYLHVDLIPSAVGFQNLSLIEDIIMIGYPLGLFDEQHNLPIVRRGITATHPAVDFNGAKAFLIDCACFRGSSGSPVLKYRPRLPIEFGAGLEVAGNEPFVQLLGVLRGGFEADGQGQFRVVDSPVNSDTTTKIPIDLGVVIRADQLLAFKSILG